MWLLSVSATTQHAVDATGRSGQHHRLVLRRFHRHQRLAADPWYTPANEAAVLELLAGTHVPAPRLLAADLDAAVCDVPALLITRQPGSPDGPRDTDRFLARLADTLSVIHTVQVTGDPAYPQPYSPYYDPAVDGERQVPDWSWRPGMWQWVLAVLAGPPPPEATAAAGAVGFIHRDYHPGQILWVGDELTGVVDWTTGCVGPRGIDLARMRINLAQCELYGLGIADRFLDAYRTASGRQLWHPYWDLLDAGDAILDMPDPNTAQERASYDRFEAWVEHVLQSC